MVFRCDDCGHIFETGEEKAWKEPHGEWFNGCPVCGGTYEQAFDCQKCGNYTTSEDDLCDECKKEAVELFKKLLNENFTEYQKKYIIELLEEGEEIWV